MGATLVGAVTKFQGLSQSIISFEAARQQAIASKMCSNSGMVRNGTRPVTGSFLQLQAEPKTKPTYHYIGCYHLTNAEEQFIKPEAPLLHLSVYKCYEFCHQKELAGVDVQFFGVHRGKQCTCLQYIDKAQNGNTEDK